MFKKRGFIGLSLDPLLRITIIVLYFLLVFGFISSYADKNIVLDKASVREIALVIQTMQTANGNLIYTVDNPLDNQNFKLINNKVFTRDNSTGQEIFSFFTKDKSSSITESFSGLKQITFNKNGNELFFSTKETFKTNERDKLNCPAKRLNKQMKDVNLVLNPDYGGISDNKNIEEEGKINYELANFFKQQYVHKFNSIKITREETKSADFEQRKSVIENADILITYHLGGKTNSNNINAYVPSSKKEISSALGCLVINNFPLNYSGGYPKEINILNLKENAQLLSFAKASVYLEIGDLNDTLDKQEISKSIFNALNEFIKNEK